jgi:hypothetical protein
MWGTGSGTLYEQSMDNRTRHVRNLKIYPSNSAQRYRQIRLFTGSLKNKLLAFPALER